VEYAMGCHCGCDFEKRQSGRRKQEARQLAKGQWEEDCMKLVVGSGRRTRILI